MMETVRLLFALTAFASAVVFGIAGIIGLFRFPDPYSRLQATPNTGDPPDRLRDLNCD